MKRIVDSVIILIILFCFSCRTERIYPHRELSPSEYRIKKIRKINHYYFITVEQNNKRYKILSHQAPDDSLFYYRNFERIKKGHIYKLALRHAKIGMGYPFIITLYDGTELRMPDEEGFVVSKSPNLVGLYYMNNDTVVQDSIYFEIL